MCKQNGLLLRGKTYYCQARIPQDIRGGFPSEFPQAVRRERLDATTLAAAKAPVRQKWADLEARFKMLRAAPAAPLRRSMSVDEARRIAAHALSHNLTTDEEARREGLSDEFWERVERDRAGLARGVFGEQMRMSAEDWLRHFGHGLPPESADYRMFL